jgi:hypothetical protein
MSDQDLLAAGGEVWCIRAPSRIIFSPTRRSNASRGHCHINAFTALYLAARWTRIQ